MLLRFIRGRMDFQVDIAPIGKPAAWREISKVVMDADCVGCQNRKIEYYGLHDFGRFFESNFDLLRHEVNKPNWRGTTGRLVPI